MKQISCLYFFLHVVLHFQHAQPLEVAHGIVKHGSPKSSGHDPGSDTGQAKPVIAHTEPADASTNTEAPPKTGSRHASADKVVVSSLQKPKITLHEGHASSHQSVEAEAHEHSMGRMEEPNVVPDHIAHKGERDFARAHRRSLQALQVSHGTHEVSNSSIMAAPGVLVQKASGRNDSLSPAHAVGTFAAEVHNLGAAAAAEPEVSFAKQIVLYWKQHGLIGSIYRGGYWVQPNLLLGVGLLIFIVAQVLALICVAQHARVSWNTLRKARDPAPQKTARFGELIPGISWQDVAHENQLTLNEAAAQVRSSVYQRRAKDSISGSEEVWDKVAREGWNMWTAKQRNQYLLSSSDDGGQAANAARLQEMLAADRNAGLASMSRGYRLASEKTQKGGEQAGTTGLTDGASLQSTLNYATRRADLNKRILSLLQRSPEQASTMESMLSMEYNTMVDMDLEHDRAGVLNEP